MLQNDGNSVTILDFSAEPFHRQRLIDALRRTDVVGLTVLSTTINQINNIRTLISQHNPDIHLLIGGPHCTLQPETALKETEADVCVQGDGEMIISDIRQAFEKQKEFSEIPGVWYRTASGIHHGPQPRPIIDLNTLPFPARNLVKRYTYGHEYDPHLKAGEFTSIITSRGCPYSCRFCSRGSVSMQQYRRRSTENIIAELKEIQQQGYRHVVFSDDCFPGNMTQAFALFDAIISENIHLKYSVTATRVDVADEELYATMRNAGVTHMQFGLESGTQEVLDFYHKHITVDMIQTAIRLSHEAGFFTIGSFIFGAPFETIEQFNRTLQFAKSLPLDSASFLPLRYMVGSSLWTQAVSERKINDNEYLVYADKARGLGMYTKEELFRYCLKAQRSFYGRPSFILNLLKHALRNDDFSYVQSYLSFLFSALKVKRK